MKWIVGTNMLGYMPDSEPNVHSNWKDAHQDLCSEIGLDLDQIESDTTEVNKAADLEHALRIAKALLEGDTCSLVVLTMNRVYFLDHVVEDETKPVYGSQQWAETYSDDLGESED